MKKFFILASVLATVIASCDKVTNAYPSNPVTSTLDWSLYPDGDSAHYAAQGLWPTFSANTNTNRNVLIEDFTGHQCVQCPFSTNLMEDLIATNPTRLYGLGIHAGPTGLTGFQVTSAAYPTVLYCDAGLELGKHFGQDIPGSTFLGNPGFCVNRTKVSNQFVSNAGSTMTNKTNACLASTLKINIQAVTNYFPSTRGLFLHTEVDKVDASLSAELAIAICVVEDSLVAPQTVPGNLDPDGSPGDPNTPDGRAEAYVHRDILRGFLDGRTFGRVLTDADKGSNGKYFVSYSYRLPDQYNVDNMKLYIYVYDKSTEEIYQVIEKHLH
ncbi:Omp28-related outer membrane protein [Fluviicola sp.]|uniref:Omp28-related outer membrane protein n=1 Tax=Fluviicola sp. TaxID=1917219 RepID=UPI002616A109|nr:Omp28-related outer membrane protein [Fluviicola sp.]